MCYDISFRSNIKDLSDYFSDVVYESQDILNFPSMSHLSGHVYGGAPIIYIPQNAEAAHVKIMHWGCIPYYIKDLKTFASQRASMINARSEKVLTDTKSYWYKIKNKRCLIPVTGFFEHRHITYQEEVLVRKTLKLKSFEIKVPYYVSLKDQKMFFIPGLYSVTELVDKETGEISPIWTFTLLTREANTLMREIHNGGDNPFRMPVLLPLELSRKWINQNLSQEEYQTILDYEMPSSNLNAYSVRSIRGRKDPTPEELKTEPFEWDKAPALSTVI